MRNRVLDLSYEALVLKLSKSTTLGLNYILKCQKTIQKKKGIDGEKGAQM